MNVMSNDQETTSEELGKISQSYHVDYEDNEKLYKQLQAILNLITLDTLHKGVEKIEDLEINTEEQLRIIVTLIFEKSLDKKSNKFLYAFLCKELALMKVRRESSDKILNQIKRNQENVLIKLPGKRQIDNNAVYQVNFRKLFITLCQEVFEDIFYDSLFNKNEDRMIEQDKQFKVNEVRKSEQIENMKLIGELFKLNMLIKEIIFECIKKLLKDGREHPLHCLCELLKVVGLELRERSNKCDATRQRMEKCYSGIQNIIDTNSRVSSMLQNTMDLIKPKKSIRMERLRQIYNELWNSISYPSQISDVCPSRSSPVTSDLEAVDTDATINTLDDQALTKVFEDSTTHKCKGDDKVHEM